MSEDWQGRTGDSWAAEWRRTDRGFAALTEELLRRSREFRFGHALDIGCGAGELSLALARGRPHVRVTGVDISPQLLAVARERSANLANASFVEGDAARWQPPTDATPDLIVSRHGVMFFADPEAAFAHFAHTAVPGCGLLFSCFRAREENPVFSDIARLLPGAEPPGDPDAPGPFAFADAARVERILIGAGWREIAFAPFDFAMITGVGPDPIEDTVEYFNRIGPAARAMAELPFEERERFAERVRGVAARNIFDGTVSLRAAAWLVTARKP